MDWGHNDLRNYYLGLLRNRVACDPDAVRPMWTSRDAKILNELMGANNPIAIAKVFRHVLENWDDVRAQFEIQGSPGLPMLRGFWGTFAAEVNGEDVRRFKYDPGNRSSYDRKDGGARIPKLGW